MEFGELFIEPYPQLLGVDVLQATSVSVTQSAQLFHWKGYGLKLQIPQQALPSHLKTCTITITATLSGQYQFPENTELVSPVFWLKCEPSCKFKVPLDLHIQHCALPDNSSCLFMATATCESAIHLRKIEWWCLQQAQW